jgi:aspartate carbamoyltransferase
MSLKGADILNAAQFTRAQIETLFASANDFATHDARSNALVGKLLATLFYEPSTRTQLGFQAAMQRLGGGILTANALHEEPIADAIRSIAGYADAIVLRHADTGAAQLAADATDTPIINAGDGTGEHPTQALIDLFAIASEKKTIDNLRIAIVGDLKNERATHSLARMLALFRVDVSLVSPAAMALSPDVSDVLRETGLSVEETNDLGKTLQKADVVYMTRVRKECFSDLKQYEKMKNFYVLTRALIEKAKPGLLVMHSLPRTDELATDVDGLTNAAYFRQSKNGLWVRMAILANMLA